MNYTLYAVCMKHRCRLVEDERNIQLDWNEEVGGWVWDLDGLGCPEMRRELNDPTILNLCCYDRWYVVSATGVPVGHTGQTLEEDLEAFRFINFNKTWRENLAIEGGDEDADQ